MNGKDRKLIAASIIVLVMIWCFFLGLGLLLSSCGASQTESGAIHMAKEECQSKALGLIALANTCKEAEASLNRLASEDPGCVVLLPGIDFGHYCKDGGQ